MCLMDMVKSEPAGVATALLTPNHHLLCESNTMANQTLRPCTVYALVSSSEPDEVRYIGQTRLLLRQRLTKHIWDARHKHIDKPSLNWIRNVLSSGQQIQIIPLVENAVPDVTEQQVIADYRAKGAALTNITAGGQGAFLAPGESRPAIVSERLWSTRRANGNDRHSAETRAKMSLSHKSREISQEDRDANAERLRAARAGQTFGPLSDPHKQKLSNALKGRPKTPEHIAAAAVGRRAVVVTPDVLEIKRQTIQRMHDAKWGHIDWIGMEHEVRNTTRSYSAIASTFGVSPECVRKRSIKGGWRG